MFIEVNKAYHALMDGKESALSSSAETSSTTSAPTTNSADPTHSDAHSKSTQASSRPPSARSNSSKQSSPCSSKHDGDSTITSSSGTQSRSSPSRSSSSPTSSCDDHKPSPYPRVAKPHPDKNQSSSGRAKSGSKFSKSHAHLRDPPASAAPKATHHMSTSTRPSGFVRSRISEKSSSSSPASSETKHDSLSESTVCTGSDRLRSSKPVIPPPSGRLRKSPKFGFAEELVQKISKGTTKGSQESPSILPHEQDEIPYGSPLHAINAPQRGTKEWIFPLPLMLDEMYHGTNYRFLVTRELLSHRTEQGCAVALGSSALVQGHQRKDGTLQDVVFLVEEVPDDRFSRVKDDLFLDVCIPWADPLADDGGELCIQGIDGKEITFTLPYPIYDKATEGQVLIKGAGMPIRDGRKSIGRGDMIVRWRVVFPGHHSKWDTFKKVLHLDV
ncbi:hypothetical protein JVU11DRAFT_4369 [Chiua virens]|nr:hypothetical protein JVU11DRAFT_4369 [Chiua virens]